MTNWKISRNQLKMIALLSMVIDHIGAVLFPEQFVFRLIGRLAFPIFGYLIVEGYIHTHNLKHYGLRLLAFGLLSEVPFDLAFSGQVLEFGHQNIFFTLATGLVGIWIYDKLKHKADLLSAILVFILALLAQRLGFDYGLFGVVMIVGIYTIQSRLYQALWIVLMMAMMTVLYAYPIQLGAGISAILIYYYDRTKGRYLPQWKYLFYIIYPLHLLILYGIRIFLVG